MEFPSLGQVDGPLVWAIGASAIVVLVSSSFLGSVNKAGSIGKPKKSSYQQVNTSPEQIRVKDVGVTHIDEESSKDGLHEEPVGSSRFDETTSLKKGGEEVLISDEEEEEKEKAKKHETPVSDDKIHEWLGRMESSRSETGDLHEDLVLPPPPPYPNGWFYLCHSNAVGRNKGPKYIKALGLHLAVFRGESGTAHVLDAFCPHLGANMGINGTVQGECIKCPFHHWAFNGKTGELENIPYSDDKKKRVSVGSYPVQEQDGLILFWVHAEGSKPTWFPPSISSDNYSDWFLYRFLGRYLPFWGFLKDLVLQMTAVIYSIATWDCSIQTRSCVTRDRIFCHIQEIPENGADAAHLNVLHSDVNLPFFRNILRHEWVWKWESSNHDLDHHHHKRQTNYRTSLETPWYMTRIEFKNSVKFLGRRLVSFQGCANQVGPGLVYINLNFPLGIKVRVIETVTPVAPMSQHVTHSLYSAALVPWPALWALSRLLQEQFLRDKSIWDHKLYLNRPYIVRKVSQTKHYRHQRKPTRFDKGQGEKSIPSFVEQDGPILAFRRWYKQFYSPNSESFDSAMKRCEREVLAAAANLSASIDSQSNFTISNVLQQVIEQKLTVSPSSYDW